MVPAGGLSPDGQQWIDSRRGFLVRVEPLSDHFRTCFRQWLEHQAPEAFAAIPAKVWKQRWVTHSQPAGSGQHVLRYLSRYVFKTATGDRVVPQLADGGLVWRYRESGTSRWQSLRIEPDELLRRFLQHVLPAGFHRVRRFGWLHPSAKAKRQRIQSLLEGRGPDRVNYEPAVAAAAVDPDDIDPFDELEAPERWVEAQILAPVKLPVPPPLCPRCGQPMRCLGRWSRGGGLGARDPPAPL